MSLTFIGGDEPYLIDNKKKTLIGNFELPDLNYLTSDALDAGVLDHLYSCPVMDDRRAALVRITHLKEADNAILKEYLETPMGTLVIQFQEYDARSSFFQELKKKNLLFLYNKETLHPDQLNIFLTKQIALRRNAMDKDAMESFLQRAAYHENESMNLYTLLSYLNSLCALGNPVTKEMVSAIVPQHYNEDIFGIAKMILTKDMEGLRIQALLQQQTAINTLSALLREYRIAYKAHYFPQKEIGISRCLLSGQSKTYLAESIHLITKQLAAVKKGNIPLEAALLDVFFRLCSLQSM